MKYVMLVLSLLLGHTLFAQFPAIRGTIADRDARMELIGVRVMLVFGNDTVAQTISDIDGAFRFDDQKPGRYTLSFSLLGFEPVVLDVEHISGRELILQAEMEERVQAIKEVEVKAQAEGVRGDAANEMATVSSRRFSLEETNRYAGSRGDPARMASNYAGVSGTDDSRNDIVVRGNSPLGVLWKVDGLWIPNPNHFAIAGSQGGPVSVLNNKVLANSDFYTGAFPAEFGNSTASVFDLRFRNGNNQKYEFTAQLGFLGTELTAEGPFSKKHKASFLFAYRYATFDLFRLMGMGPETLKKLIGTSAIPAYQDLNMKLNFPLSSKTNLSIFALGGLSKINTVLSTETVPSDELLVFGDNDRDQYLETGMGMVGASLNHQVSDKAFLQAAVGWGAERQFASHDYFVRHVDSTGATPVYVYDTLPQPLMRYTFIQHRISATISYTHKFSARHVLKFGASQHQIFLNNVDSSLNDAHAQWQYRWDYQGMTFLTQAYAQYKYRASERLTLTAGIHSQYFDMSETFSPVEPRIGLRYRAGKRQMLSLGAGLHSQIQPLYLHVYRAEDSNGKSGLFNFQMDMSKSWHVVGGYDVALGQSLRLKTEVYYQHLFNVPVEADASAFSLLNAGSGFSRIFPGRLTNTGTGTNYGLELTVEKFFSRKLFFLVTGTLYNSTYKGSDGITRNTDYNGNYVLNLLAGSEWKTGEKGLISFGGKVTWGGGKRYGLVDTVATEANNELIYLDEGYNTLRFRDYFRLDVKVNYRHNAGKVTHEVGFDLVNLTNQDNLLGLAYTGNPDAPIGERYQLGFLPLFYYKIDF
jgi:hypothetical protein